MVSNPFPVSLDLLLLDISYKWKSSLLNLKINCTNQEFYGKVDLIKKTIFCFPLFLKSCLAILWSVTFRFDGNFRELWLLEPLEKLHLYGTLNSFASSCKILIFFLEVEINSVDSGFYISCKCCFRINTNEFIISLSTLLFTQMYLFSIII